MRRCVGYVEYHGKHLKYYVFGNRSEGFGVEITETCVEKTVKTAFHSFGTAWNLAQKLRRGLVFPANLNEILDDSQFENESD